MCIVLLLDADNTLWDTNAVFAKAQYAGIDILEQHGVSLSYSGLQRLREVDSYLIDELGTFEYDFDHLMQALILWVKGYEPRVAAQSISHGEAILTEKETSVARYAADALRTTLSNDIPPLLPGASSLLAWLSTQRSQPDRKIASFLVSEGDEGRLLRTVAHHGLDDGGDYFDGVRVVPSKTDESFRKIAAEGRALLRDDNARVICIGDSLRRDIAPANAIGAITIYKPAGFMGHESPGGPDDTPTHTVQSLADALTLVKSMAGN